MNILITFDVELWCNSWQTLESDFPSSFERYVFGRSKHGQYALPETLEILDRHKLRGVFFVEPLFAARFGVEHLAHIVELIKQAGQEIQLHLHPEWTDEARDPLLPKITHKRQHLSYYDADEQHLLIQHGLRLMQEAGVTDINAFRAGSFACNSDTFGAIIANGLRFDSSINPTVQISDPGHVRDARAGYCEPFAFEGLSLYPMSVFRDGFGRLRHAQIGACSASELAQAMQRAREIDWDTFILLSHNFELMIPDRCEPDHTVVKRFKQICRFLSENRDTMPTTGFHDLDMPRVPKGLELAQTGRIATTQRYFEQALRRLHA